MAWICTQEWSLCSHATRAQNQIFWVKILLWLKTQFEKMFFLLILDSRDAFDLSLLETNLTECYLRSSCSPLPMSLSSSAWGPLGGPSLDTNKCPSSERWIQSAAFIGDTNSVFSVLHSALSFTLQFVEGSGSLADWFKCILHLWQSWCGLWCNQSTLPIKHPILWSSDVRLLILSTRRDRVTFSIWNIFTSN